MSQDDQNTVADIVVNVGTLGVAGVKDGQIAKGAMLRGADEVVGEVTGRNAARKQIMEGKDAIAKEAADKAKELKNEATLKQQKDFNASTYAASVRATAGAQQSQLLGNNPTKDFLGL